MIKKRIAALAKAATKASADYGSGQSVEDFCVVQTALEAEYRAISRDVGQGLVVGRALSFGVGDGEACYLVTKVRKNDVVVEHIELGDGYHFLGCYDNGKGELCLPRPVAEMAARF